MKLLEMRTEPSGAVAGEKQGPLSLVPKKVGWTIAGVETVSVDLVFAMLMGFDYNKIPQIQNAVTRKELGLSSWAVDDLRVLHSPDNRLTGKDLPEISDRFEVPEGWQGFLQSTV